MTGGKGGGLVQEEQLGPAARAHDGAPDVAVPEGADQPGAAGPATGQQRAGLRIVQDASIAGEQSPFRRRDDVAQGRDTVLQRHGRSGPSSRIVEDHPDGAPAA